MKKSIIIDRPRINKLLDGIYDVPLYIISATMGYGKTISIKNFINKSSDDCIWVSMYQGLLSSHYFDNIFHQIKTIDVNLYNKFKKVSSKIDDISMMSVINVLERHKFNKEIILVFDDFHTIEDNIMLEFVKRVTRLEIDKFHIVITTRDTELKSFSDILTHCEIITSNQLKFTLDEVEKLSEKFDVKLDTMSKNNILEYSDGMASVVFLLIKGLKNEVEIDKNYSVNLLIKNTMFDTLEIRDKNILLNLCFLGNFTADEAIFITADEKCGKRLYQLSEKIPFIQHTRDSFILHSVFADFLIGQAYIEDINIKENYLLAGKYHIQIDDYVNAFKYYDLAGDIERLFIDKSEKSSIGLINFPKFICDIVEKCDSEMYVKYPFSFLDIGSMLFLGESISNKELGAKIMLTMHEMAKQNMFGKLNDMVLAETYVMNIFIVFNDAKKIVQNIYSAKDTFGDNNSTIITKHSPITFGSPSFLYMYYNETGKYKWICDYMIEHIVHFPKFTGGCGEGSELVAKAEYLLEIGSVKNAELVAYRAIHKTRTYEQIGLEICASFVILKVNLLYGNLKEIENMLYSLEILVSKSQNKSYEITLDMVKAYVYSIIGLESKIPKWLFDFDNIDNEYRTIGIGFINIVRSKILLCKEDYNLLEIETHITEESFNDFNNQLGIIHNNIHKAIIDIKTKGKAEGESSLYKALKYSKKDNIIAPYIENTNHILDTLKDVAINHESDKYIQDVLIKCKQHNKNIKALSNKNLLSKSEIRVLKVLMKGSRNDVAKELNISINTVQTHIRRIYLKLDVKTKQKAIERAKSLNIIK